MKTIHVLLSSVLFFSCVKNPEKKEVFYNGTILVDLPDNWKVISHATFGRDPDDYFFNEFVGDSLTASGVRIEVRNRRILEAHLDRIVDNEMEIQKLNNITTKITKTGKRVIDGKSFSYYQYELEIYNKTRHGLALMCVDHNNTPLKFNIVVVDTPLKKFEEISDGIASSIVIKD